MNAYDFVDKQLYNAIVDAVKNQSDFEYTQRHGKCFLWFSSGRAGCDFCRNRVRKGDYVMSINFTKGYGNYSGHGMAYSIEELTDIIGDYKSFAKLVDKGFSQMDIKDYMPVDSRADITESKFEQLSLF